MPTLLLIILATTIISLGSLVGVLTLAIKKTELHRFLILLISISAGTLMGGAFLHLLPEAVELTSPSSALSLTLLSFIGFYVIENLFFWRHCHRQGHCDRHAFGVLNLIGDGLHNFLDGLLLAAAFTVSPELGLTTTIAIAFHEIPQEIGDFGVLLYSGYSRRTALIANLMVSLTAVFGGVLGYFFSSLGSRIETSLLPLAAGGFIYISASDLMPEIRRQTHGKRSISTFSLFLVGVLIMWLLKLIGVDS